jgi:hypothetical protein
MKLFAHLDAQGELHGLVATLDGERNTELLAPPGMRTYLVSEHGLKDDSADLDQLTKALETHRIEITSTRVRLIRPGK